MKEESLRLKLWEKALLALLCVLLSAALWAQGETERISSSLIRLHVLAVDDSPGEQALKLRVRDAVLACLEEKMGAAESKEAAEALLADALGEIEGAARSAAEGREVAVTLTREYYPTRRYDSFALPAGRYDSLRVVLGEGKGHNWWCVVFPPLCLAAESCETAEEALASQQLQFPSADGTALCRFKLLELWGELTGRRTGQGFCAAA